MAVRNADSEQRWRWYRRSLAEMWTVLAVWALAGVWTIAVSFALGLRVRPEQLSFPLGLGIPHWVLWGVVVPWIVCNAVTVVMCFWGIEDIPLDSEADRSDVSGTDA